MRSGTISYLKGLITYTSKQSSNALKASREELTKNGISYDLFHIDRGLKKPILIRFGKKLKKDLLCIFSLMFNKYDFLIINAGAGLMQRIMLTRCLIMISRLKDIDIYVRWGNEKLIFQKVLKLMGAKKYRTACSLMNSKHIKYHLTLSPASAKDIFDELGIKNQLLIYNCNKLPEEYLLPRLPDEPPVVLNVATVQYLKGPDLFVKIASIVCAKHSTVRFVWVGDYADQLSSQLIKEMKLEDRVAFIGKIKPPYDWMQKASLLLFTSRSDAFGLVCAEAMACHRTVVCFSGSGPEFVVGDTGVVVPQWNIEQAANQVLDIINKPAEERINSAANQRYLEMFSPEKYANRLAEVIHNPDRALEKYKFINLN